MKMIALTKQNSIINHIPNMKMEFLSQSNLDKEEKLYNMVRKIEAAPFISISKKSKRPSLITNQELKFLNSLQKKIES